MNIDSIQNIYFIGIGGIGMSALARYFNIIGKNVAGYDRTPTGLTDMLINEGIDIHFEDDLNFVPDVYKKKENTIVVYTPAVPANHAELNFFKINAFVILKRAEALGLITENVPTIAISGTHGKTTTTSMTAHILLSAGVDSCAFLGGISKNYSTNFLAYKLLNKDNKEKISKDDLHSTDYAVVEADEFDRSFLKLSPYIAVVTSADADHLDIYGDKESVKKAFADFVNKIHPHGKLIIKKGVNIGLSKYPVLNFTYALTDKKADFYATNMTLQKNNLYKFDIVTPQGIMEDLTVGVPGKLNVENAIAAVAVAVLTGVDEDKIREALASYKGVKRRFDYQINAEHLIYIDDYAHHPEELKAFIQSIKEIFVGKKITAIFQPHLYTRTRDFADEFAKSLELVDELILLEIYPAREEPIPGIDSKMLLDKVKIENKYLCPKDDIIEFIKNRELQVLLTIGAGDIEKIVEPLKNVLVQEKNK